MTAKPCTRCGETKPRDEFYKSRSAKDGLGSRCRACQAAYVKEWRAANRERDRETRKAYYQRDPQKVSELGRKYRDKKRGGPPRATPTEEEQLLRKEDGRLRRAYGISTAERDQIYEDQQHRCACCRKPIERRGRHTHVEHCHKTNQVFGLVCRHCNTAVGMCSNSYLKALQVAEYIKKTRGQGYIERHILAEVA